MVPNAGSLSQTLPLEVDLLRCICFNSIRLLNRGFRGTTSPSQVKSMVYRVLLLVSSGYGMLSTVTPLFSPLQRLVGRCVWPAVSQSLGCEFDGENWRCRDGEGGWTMMLKRGRCPCKGGGRQGRGGQLEASRTLLPCPLSVHYRRPLPLYHGLGTVHRSRKPQEIGTTSTWL